MKAASKVCLTESRFYFTQRATPSGKGVNVSSVIVNLEKCRWLPLFQPRELLATVLITWCLRFVIDTGG